MSFVVGLVYYKLAYGQSNIRDWFGLMYILAALYPYMVILDVIAQCKFRKIIKYGGDFSIYLCFFQL